MQQLMDIAAVFALDLFSESKLPCFLTKWDYFDRIWAAILAPIIFAVFTTLCCAFQVTRKHRQRDHRRSIWSKAVWQAAPIVLFVMDIFFPALTRTPVFDSAKSIFVNKSSTVWPAILIVAHCSICGQVVLLFYLPRSRRGRMVA